MVAILILFSCHLFIQVYGSSSGANIKLTVCIEDHKFNPKNFWYVYVNILCNIQIVNGIV